MANVLYLSVVEDIKKRIISGALGPGDMLKSESELMKEYDVSRMTLRKSLSLLSNQGYIYSVPGKGNFIRKPDVDTYEFRFNQYDSLLTEIDEIKLLSVIIDTAPGDIQSNLSLKSGEQVVRIERLIYSDHRPIALEIVYTSYIPNKPVVEDKLNFANYSKALETKLAFGIKKELAIRIVEADRDLCKKLNIVESEDVFLVSKKTLKKENNAPLTYSLFYIKKEFFILTAKTPEEDDSRKIF
ncbi:GntR family transcriptional regulator [Geosporobacter ferrireducens]|uniref:Transcriptional regulator n=1 Tax=Geosporobacter ferrireducens TaxID=1424294 RepID=A0A1D8GJA6_9FIRM|nr:GntR family transcriptional regulator [Geosporobacter ferrireducens]AOT70990.1 transcriptional regulator [Geosporobacter ferrireducens]MTI53708.1 GntR family transcriptional regulator [Geosporobacter ferrireducens]